MKSLPVIRYRVSLLPHIKEVSLQNEDGFLIEYCISYDSSIEDAQPVLTDLQIIVDNRVTSDYNSSTVEVTKDEQCKNITMKLTVSIFFHSCLVPQMETKCILIFR